MYTNHQTKIHASEARQRFFELLEEIEKSHKPLIIEKKGRPVAVLLDYQVHLKYEKGKKKEVIGDFFARLSRFQKKLSKSRGGPAKTDSVSLLRSLRDES